MTRSYIPFLKIEYIGANRVRLECLPYSPVTVSPRLNQSFKLCRARDNYSKKIHFTSPVTGRTVHTHNFDVDRSKSCRQTKIRPHIIIIKSRTTNHHGTDRIITLEFHVGWISHGRRCYGVRQERERP